jgi:hypothetical protein
VRRYGAKLAKRDRSIRDIGEAALRPQGQHNTGCAYYREVGGSF